MKKALSVLLSMLVIFSMVGVMAFAEGEETESTLVTVVFKNDDGTVLSTVQAVPGTILNKYAPEYPSKAETETTRYTFKHWMDEATGETYPGNAALPAATTDTTFVAVYSEEDLSDRMTLWNFIESIFERINLIFEYFATVFGW